MEIVVIRKLRYFFTVFIFFFFSYWEFKRSQILYRLSEHKMQIHPTKINKILEYAQRSLAARKERKISWNRCERKVARTRRRRNNDEKENKIYTDRCRKQQQQHQQNSNEGRKVHRIAETQSILRSTYMQMGKECFHFRCLFTVLQCMVHTQNTQLYGQRSIIAQFWLFCVVHAKPASRILPSSSVVIFFLDSNKTKKGNWKKDLLTARNHLTVGFGHPPYVTVKQTVPPINAVQSSGPRIKYVGTSAIGLNVCCAIGVLIWL